MTMPKRNSIFFDRVSLIIKNKISLIKSNPKVRIPEKYHQLFKNFEKNYISSLNGVSHVIDDILSRKEEQGSTNLYRRGRFIRNKSLLVQNELDQSPIVDELIYDIIKQLGLKVRNIWPNSKKAIVCLTHDVDSFDGTSYLGLRKAFWLTKSFLGLCKLKINESRNWLQKIRKWQNIKRDPIFAFDQWMELEDKYGLRSTFFFMSLKKTLSKEGRRYSYKNPRVCSVINELNKGGWEIGLHAAYYNHLKLNYLKEQKHRLEDIINHEILGCRHHYLRVRFPESWTLYKEAGFRYSSNMGWGSGENGFRAGTCFPYQPVNNNEKIEITEIPFQLMDSNKIKNSDSYIKIFLDYLYKVKKVSGCLVLNFHQESFDEEQAPGVNIAYKEILDILSKDKEVLVAPLKNIFALLTPLC